MENKEPDYMCDGCEHIKNPPPKCHCYMFRERFIGCKLNASK